MGKTKDYEGHILDEEKVLQLKIDAGEVCRYKWNRTHFLLNPETGQVLDISCKSWRCNKHAPRWLTKWRIVVTRELNKNPINRLITLTCAEDCTPFQLNYARRRLMHDIRKEFEGFEYLSVLEFTSESRLPHLHLLCRTPYIPQKRLSYLWSEATKAANIKPSPIVYIEKPRTQEGSAVYALSYALAGKSKGQDIPDTWRGRKITYSKKFFVAGTVKEHWLSWIRETFGEKPEGDKWFLMEGKLEN